MTETSPTFYASFQSFKRNTLRMLALYQLRGGCSVLLSWLPRVYHCGACCEGINCTFGEFCLFAGHNSLEFDMPLRFQVLCIPSHSRQLGHKCSPLVALGIPSRTSQSPTTRLGRHSGRNTLSGLSHYFFVGPSAGHDIYIISSTFAMCAGHMGGLGLCACSARFYCFGRLDAIK